MNKQQLASIIWESANQMRSKIEANEYKDFILGFIFYKYLSDKEVEFLRAQGRDDEGIKAISPDDEGLVAFIKNRLGYFIAYDDLFSTWLAKRDEFDVSDVTDALNSFDQNIDSAYEKVFKDIFKTLSSSLSKLGDTSAKRTNAIKKLLKLIKKIPTDRKQDYDVIGFVYEYLIGMFAANAGKKGGEFYTPNEVSILMSEIISEFLKDREQISIYDSCSGSGSLLINIGASAAKYIIGKNKIDYYAQELKEYTYNLTRMNLIMRGIEPQNIYVRNGDTLEDDWPFFEDNDIDNTYQLVRVDAVVSNPPYSQKWDISDKELDPRYRDYGIAPKGKSDLAFLLHDLYHLENGGIMTIVLPHGVLFRGGEEAKIRENLIEKNQIDAIIGLPANVFFGTGIPTIIIVLKRKRVHDDVLIIDASKGFEKVGKNNKLRASDIKKIVDVVSDRSEIAHFSKIVTKDEIRANEYNLNIPRYVDSSAEEESWDIHSLMFGGIPKDEIARLAPYWHTFKGLKADLFSEASAKHMTLKVANPKETISQHPSIHAYQEHFAQALSRLPETLKAELIDNIINVNLFESKLAISDTLFTLIAEINLIDKYRIYQIFADKWQEIAGDLEIIQNDGFSAISCVEPNMVIAKDGNNDEVHEIQQGYKGKILPFSLIQKTYLQQESAALERDNNRLSEILSEYEALLESVPEDDEYEILNDNKNAFASPAIKTARAKIVKEKITPESDSVEHVVLQVFALMEEEKQLKKSIKAQSMALDNQAQELITQLDEDECLKLIEIKWITSLIDLIKDAALETVADFIAQVVHLADKYASTFADIDRAIAKTSRELVGLIDELAGDEFDTQGLREWQKTLGV